MVLSTFYLSCSCVKHRTNPSAQEAMPKKSSSVPAESASTLNELHICRACLSENGDMRPLYGSCLDVMLMTVAEIRVKMGDGLPETLCVQCVLQVSRTFTFKKLCQRSDATLREMYVSAVMGQQQTTTTDVDDKSALIISSDCTDKNTSEIGVAEQSNLVQQVDGVNANRQNDQQQINNKNPEIVNPLAQPQYYENTQVGDIPGITTSGRDGSDTNDDKSNADQMNTNDLPLLNESDTRILCDSGSTGLSADADIIEQCTQMSMTDINIIDMESEIIPSIADVDDVGNIVDDFDSYDDCTNNDPDTDTFLVTVDASLFEDDDNHQPADNHPTSGYTTSQPGLECEICHKFYGDSKVLRRHRKIHNAQKPHVCAVCDMSFAESSNLTKHQKRHTGELRNVVGKPNLCSVCGKRFKWASSLSKHMKHHTRHKILTCPYCPKYYVEARSLNIHVRSHTGEKPFACALCPKSFTQAGNLDKHMRVHTGEKPYACPLCGKRFSQSGYVAIHMRTHTGERPYRCGDCGKGFAGSNTLAIHIRTHTGERPYECAICARRFARQETAQIHQRTHTGERPHVCPVCQRGFTSSGHLTGHMRSHSGEKSHACDRCGKRFAGPGSLKVHMRSHASTAPVVIVADQATTVPMVDGDGQTDDRGAELDEREDNRFDVAADDEEQLEVYACSLCDCTFIELLELEQHVGEHDLATVATLDERIANGQRFLRHQRQQHELDNIEFDSM